MQSSSGLKARVTLGTGKAQAAAASASRATRAMGGQRLTNKPAPQAVTDPSPRSAGAKAPRAPEPAAATDDAQQQRRPPQPRAGGGGRLGGSGGQKKVVVILAKAGLKMGQEGLVNAYERTISTAPPPPHLAPYRPDIVHQCLLALYDSDLAVSGRLQVLIQTERGKTIEVAPNLRPPRTYHRFKGVMEGLLNNGSVINRETGDWLMRTTRWSIAPQIPHGAEVFGIHNGDASPVASAIELAKAAVAEPVDASLQGGIKNAYGFYCISCTDDSNLDGLDFITKTVCLSKYPTTPHVACLRLAEGFRYATSAKTNTDATGEAASELTVTLQPQGLGQKKPQPKRRVTNA